MMIKKVKMGIALTLASALVVSTPATAYARAERSAIIKNTGLEEILVAGGAIVGSEALGYILAALGFTAASAAVYDNRESIIEWCSNEFDEIVAWNARQAVKHDVDAIKFKLWLDKIANGALDTADECWQMVKDYVVACGSVEKMDTSFQSAKNNGTSYKRCNDTVSFIYYDAIEKQNWWTRDGYLEIKETEKGLEHGSFMSKTNIMDWVYLFQDGVFYSAYINNSYTGLKKYERSGYKYSNIPCFSDEKVALEFLKTGKVSDFSGVCEKLLPAGFHFNDEMGIDTTNHIKDGANADGVGKNGVIAKPIQNIIDRDGTLDNVSVIPVDGTKVVDDVISIPVEGITDQDIAHPFPDDSVMVVDDVTDTVFPEDKPKDEVKKDRESKTTSKKKTKYTIEGLGGVFPFCVPFDLISLYKVMQAEPEAPKFDFPFPSYTKKGLTTVNYTVDMKMFDTVAKVFRVMELLAFCVGLTLVTRKLIRG